MTDIIDRVERFRFLGREFLLWLWVETEAFETDFRPTGVNPVALWFESRLALAFDEDEALLKSASPAQSPEAKEALRRGKLPKEARLRVIREGLEYAFTMKADTLGLTAVSIPAELKTREDTMDEVLYERMRLLEDLETTLEALYGDFLRLRLSPAWEADIVPEMGRWAHGQGFDDKKYLAVKSRVLKKKKKS